MTGGCFTETEGATLSEQETQERFVQINPSMPAATHQRLKLNRWKKATSFSFILAAVVGTIGYNIGLQQTELQLQNEITKTSDYLDSYLSQPRRALRIMKLLVEKDNLNLKSKEQTGRELWKLATQFPDIAYFNYGLLNGDFIGVGRIEPNSETLDFETSDAKNFDRLEVRPIDKSGSISTHVKTKTWADFRQDAWFKEPLGHPEFTWASIYNWIDEPSVMVIGSGIGIRKNGKIIGTAGVDLFVEVINKKLQELTKHTRHVLVITEMDGMLVASSTTQRNFDIIDNKVKRRHLSASAIIPGIQKSDSNETSPEQNGNSKITNNSLLVVKNWTDGMGLGLKIIATSPLAPLQLSWLAVSTLLAICTSLIILSRPSDQ